VELVLPIQENMKKYVSIRDCMAAWKLYSTSSARHRLRELVKRGMAEEIKFGNRVRYHIIKGKDEE